MNMKNMLTKEEAVTAIYNDALENKLILVLGNNGTNKSCVLTKVESLLKKLKEINVLVERYHDNIQYLEKSKVKNQCTVRFLLYPEFMLDEKSRAKLGFFLCDYIDNKNAVIVETFSDIIFDAVRVKVSRGEIDHRNISLYLFRENGVEILKLNYYGRLLDWPRDLFNVRVDLMMELLNPKNYKK